MKPRGWFVVAGVISLTGASVNAQVFVEVAELDQPAPDTSLAFSALQQMLISRDGTVVVWALAGGRSGIWAGPPGAVHLVALQGESRPDGGAFNNVAFPLVADDGVVLFREDLNPGTAWWWGTRGSLIRLLQTGFMPCGFGLAPSGDDQLNPRGTAACGVSQVGASTVVPFAGMPATFGPLYCPSDSAPCLGENARLQSLADVVINHGGQCAYLAGTSVAGSGTPVAVYRVGTPCPLAVSGPTSFNLVQGGIRINNRGTVSFFAREADFVDSIWTCLDTAAFPLVTEGDPAPFYPSGSQIAALYWASAASSIPRTVLDGFDGSFCYADISGPQPAAGTLWRFSPAGATLLFRPGTRAAAGGGATLEITSPRDLVVSPVGRVVGTVSLPAAPANSNAAIVMGNTAGSWRIILREGQLLTLNGITRAVSSWVIQADDALSGGEDGMRSSFNAAGQITLEIRFAGGDRVFAVCDLGAPCAADIDNSGSIDSNDFFAFLTLFFQGHSAADVNHDGSVNSQDFFDFLNAFFAGC